MAMVTLVTPIGMSSRSHVLEDPSTKTPVPVGLGRSVTRVPLAVVTLTALAQLARVSCTVTSHVVTLASKVIS